MNKVHHQLQGVQDIKDRRNVSKGTNEEEGRRKNVDKKRSEQVPKRNEVTGVLSKHHDDYPPAGARILYGQASARTSVLSN